MPDTIPDTAPRHVRYALQNFSKGYRLYATDDGIYWRHETGARAPLGCSKGFARRIIDDLGDEYGDRIVVQTGVDLGKNGREPESSEDQTPDQDSKTMTETKETIRLDKAEYTTGEIADMIGRHPSTVRNYADNLTTRKDGDYNSAPILYVTDDKLVDFLKEMGLDVTINKDVVYPLDTSDVPSGDGYDGEAYVLDERWEPTPEGLKLLPQPVRDHIEALEASLLEEQERYDTLEKEIEEAFEANADEDMVYPGAAGAVQRMAGAIETLLLMNEKQETLTAWIDDLWNDTYDGLPFSTLEDEESPLCRMKAILEYERGRGDRYHMMYNNHGSGRDEIQRQLSEAHIEIDELRTSCDEYELKIKQLKGDVVHAHEKGRADAEYEINRIYEADPASVHLAHLVSEIRKYQDLPPTRCGDAVVIVAGTQHDLVVKAYRHLISVRASGDEDAIESAEETLENVMGHAQADARETRRSLRRIRMRELVNQLLPL